MFVGELNSDVYFCTSLIEIITSDSSVNQKYKNYTGQLAKKMKCEFTCLKCPQCIGSISQTNDCEMNLFDCKKYLVELKKSISIDRLRKSNKLTENSGDQEVVASQSATQSYLFFTQNDADCYTRTQKNNETESQYLRINSILDALENIGYYGYLTFIAVIQRIGKHTLYSIIRRKASNKL